MFNSVNSHTGITTSSLLNKKGDKNKTYTNNHLCDLLSLRRHYPDQVVWV